MVIVTTFHIDRARDLVITNSNSIRDLLLNKLQALSDELITVSTNLGKFRSSTKTNLQLIYNSLRNDHNHPESSATTTVSESLGEPLEITAETLQRTFFQDATLAIDATRALLGYVPPARYNVPPIILPLDELYGQLHALHQNSLEWLTHVSHNVDSVLNVLNPSGPFSQGDPISKMRDALGTLSKTVDSIHLSLQSTTADPNRPSSSRNSTKLDDISQSLESLHHKVDELCLSLQRDKPKPHTTPSSDVSSPKEAAKDLPTYLATHPTRPCRTYGTILFDNTSSRIPMDIVGRPASTALRLELSVTPSNQSTTVTYKVFDDGYLLISDNAETSHKLQHFPSDCLALLHQKCPSFIYKIQTHGLC
uniref:40 kDa protein n=1 Tax=Garlic virus A TaxID=12433 RepID=M9PQ32_9VIRU|nr:40 kDa protein [Garlic virus A]